jgi:hypothetical protein
MTGFTETAVDVFAPTDAAGYPRSVQNDAVQRWGTEVERLIIALIADQGGDIDLPNLLVRATVTGGTGNNIVAVPNLPLTGPGMQLISLQTVAENSGPITLDLGDGAKPLLTNGGQQIAAGEVKANDMFLLADAGVHYRLYADPSSLRNKEAAELAQHLAEAAQFAAQAAQAAAEAARDIAAGYASDAVSQGNVPIYSTVAGMPSLEVPVGIQTIRVNGYASSGDGGGGLFVDQNNGSTDTFQSGGTTARTWYRAYEYENSVAVPDDIGKLNPGVSAPSINVLGYPNSPGARNDWVRSDSNPSHGIYRTDENGQVWVPSAFTVKAQDFGPWQQNQIANQALQNAVDFSVARGYGQIILPPGNVYLENLVSGDSSSKIISIIGAGMQSTTLTLDAISSANGIAFTSADRLAATHFRDFSIVIDGQASGGTALKSTMPPGGVKDRPSAILQNVRVNGLAIATDYVTFGIDVTGHWRPRLIDCFATGCWGPEVVAPDGLYSDTDPRFLMNKGFILDGCYSPYVVRCRASSAHWGFFSQGTAEEAWYFHECIANEVRKGYYIERTDPEPLGYMYNCHASYRDNGIWIKGGKFLEIYRNLIYQIDPNNHSLSAPVDILLSNVTDTTLAANTHHYDGDTRRIANQIDTSALARDIDIFDYNVTGTVAEVVRIGLGASGVQLRPGRLTGTIGQHLAGTFGQANITVLRRVTPTTEVVRTGSPQGIPNNVFTAVQWNTKTRDDLGMFDAGASSTNFVVPAHEGIRFVRVSVNVEFAANDTGVRAIRLRRNGAAAQGGFNELQPAGSGAYGMAVTSGKVAVAAGDVLTVEVFQTSGADLDLNAGLYSWCSLEVVN